MKDLWKYSDDELKAWIGRVTRELQSGAATGTRLQSLRRVFGQLIKEWERRQA